MPVVVAVDERPNQERLIKEGVKLAEAFTEELQVLHVLSQSTFTEMEQQSFDETGRTIDMDTIRKTAEEIADAAAKGVTDTYTAVGLVGSPKDEIVKYVDRNDASYLVIGGQKRSAVGKALFGSTTQSVLLGATVPVLTVMGAGDSD
ncbi:universal stress protein (plasmid) [Haloferacaceae archaeon DSL9]